MAALTKVGARGFEPPASRLRTQDTASTTPSVAPCTPAQGEHTSAPKHPNRVYRRPTGTPTAGTAGNSWRRFPKSAPHPDGRVHTPTCDRLADFLDDKAGACAGAELAAENTEQAFVAQVEETMFRAAAAALRATPSEPSEARYEVVIRWSWSRYGFHEENRYHIDAPASADKVVRSLCKRVADRYGFDCGRLDQPLNPYVSSVRVVRIGTETPLDTTPFNAHLDECVEDFRVRAVRAATVRAKEGR